MSEKVEAVSERYVVPGLIRGLQILQTFTRERQEQTVAEMARLVGVTPSTAFRIVYTLEMAGFLRKVQDTRRYRLGTRVLALGYSFLAGTDLVEVANPFLRRLRDDTNASAQLTVREGRDVVYVLRFQGTTSLVSAVSVGSRLPAHATAPGRVLLAALPLAEVVSLYEGYKFETYTADTPTDIASLIALVERDRKHAAVVSWGFYDKKIASIAVPVFNALGKVEAAVSVSCPIDTYDRKTFEDRIRRKVEDATHEISAGLGYRSSAG